VDALAVPVMVGIPNPLAVRLRFPISPPPALPDLAPAVAAGSAAECRRLGWKVAGNARVPRTCKSVPLGFKGGGDGCGRFPIDPVGAADLNHKAGSPGVSAARFRHGARLPPDWQFGSLRLIERSSSVQRERCPAAAEQREAAPVIIVMLDRARSRPGISCGFRE
jgi:hypothetical protein